MIEEAVGGKQKKGGEHFKIFPLIILARLTCTISQYSASELVTVAVPREANSNVLKLKNYVSEIEDEGLSTEQ